MSNSEWRDGTDADEGPSFERALVEIIRIRKTKGFNSIGGKEEGREESGVVVSLLSEVRLAIYPQLTYHVYGLLPPSSPPSSSPRLLFSPFYPPPTALQTSKGNLRNVLKDWQKHNGAVGETLGRVPKPYSRLIETPVESTRDMVVEVPAH